MDRSIALFGIGLVFGGTAGFLAAAANGVTLDGHEHEHGVASHGSMDHGEKKHEELLAISAAVAPELNIVVIPDPKSGWNLKIDTGNFRFAPEKASTPHVSGEGHAHIYINGEKVARHYSNWFHIASLPEGENTITVSLNANDHRQLAVGEKAIEASTVVTAN
ncbi:MAG: hypothetical protein ACR2O3_13540 [Rhizobiaceae bacterium]